MVATQSKETQRAKYTRLMREGDIAKNQGDFKRAHLILRRAAMLQPGEEQVWLALLNVVETDDDKKACLRNIITINPNNLQARERLRSFHDTEPTTTPVMVSPHPEKRRTPQWLRKIFWVGEAVVMGALLAIAVSLIANAL